MEVDYTRSSVLSVVPPARPRKLAKVPFVELADGRLQGVVSSGSDIKRVYVTAIGQDMMTCSTNNNRPCGGGGWCNHLHALMSEGALQYGLGRVARYLGVKLDADATPFDLRDALNSSWRSEPAGTVFGRFTHYLSYLELEGSTRPIPELAWFPATGAA